MKQIATRLNVSPASVHMWTRDIRIEPRHAKRNLRRSRNAFADTWAEIHRERRRQAQAEGRLRAREGDALHEAGCMLYWAEGKKCRNTVALSNSDPNMVRFFARFVRQCFGVPSEDFALRLNVYLTNGLGLPEIEAHWLSLLSLPRTCLRGHTLNHYPTSSSGTKRDRLPYGVCTLSVQRSTHLVQHIYGAIQEYGGFEEPRWLDGPPRKRRPRPESTDQ